MAGFRKWGAVIEMAWSPQRLLQKKKELTTYKTSLTLLGAT